MALDIILPGFVDIKTTNNTMEILSMINDRYNFSRNVMYLSYKEQVFSSVQSVVQD